MTIEKLQDEEYYIDGYKVTSVGKHFHPDRLPQWLEDEIALGKAKINRPGTYSYSITIGPFTFHGEGELYQNIVKIAHERPVSLKEFFDNPKIRFIEASLTSDDCKEVVQSKILNSQS